MRFSPNDLHSLCKDLRLTDCYFFVQSFSAHQLTDKTPFFNQGYCKTTLSFFKGLESLMIFKLPPPTSKALVATFKMNSTTHLLFSSFFLFIGSQQTS